MNTSIDLPPPSPQLPCPYMSVLVQIAALGAAAVRLVVPHRILVVLGVVDVLRPAPLAGSSSNHMRSSRVIVQSHAFI